VILGYLGAGALLAGLVMGGFSAENKSTHAVIAGASGQSSKH